MKTLLNYFIVRENICKSIGNGSHSWKGRFKNCLNYILNVKRTSVGLKGPSPRTENVFVLLLRKIASDGHCRMPRPSPRIVSRTGRLTCPSAMRIGGEVATSPI